MLQGIEEGWYDGGSIAFAVILVIVVTGMKINAQCYSVKGISLL